MNLKDKVALVTGGSSGIGRSISRKLAENGVKLGINYLSNDKKAEKTIKEVKRKGSEAIKLKANISNPNEVEKILQKIIKEFNNLDILINNAGIFGEHQELENIGKSEWEKVLSINLDSAYYCSKSALPYLKQGNNDLNGKIINLSSMDGKTGGFLGPHYSASKAGVIGLTFSLAHKLSPDITVNAIAPGPVNTRLISDEEIENLSKKMKMNRIAEPEEIASTALFLLKNDFINGEVIDVNGGEYMD